MLSYEGMGRKLPIDFTTLLAAMFWLLQNLVSGTQHHSAHLM